jgi:hypothetical protein
MLSCRALMSSTYRKELQCLAGFCPGVFPVKQQFALGSNKQAWGLQQGPILLLQSMCDTCRYCVVLLALLHGLYCLASFLLFFSSFRQLRHC